MPSPTETSRAGHKSGVFLGTQLDALTIFSPQLPNSRNVADEGLETKMLRLRVAIETSYEKAFLLLKTPRSSGWQANSHSGETFYDTACNVVSLRLNISELCKESTPKFSHREKRHFLLARAFVPMQGGAHSDPVAFRCIRFLAAAIVEFPWRADSEQQEGKKNEIQ